MFFLQLSGGSGGSTGWAGQVGAAAVQQRICRAAASTDYDFELIA